MRFKSVAALILSLVSVYAVATERPLVYPNADRFSEGLATVQIDGKWGFINYQGEVVIPAIYTAAGGFSHGFALVRQDAKTLYLDHSGNEYEQRPAIPFDGYSAAVLRHFFVIDSNGEALWGFENQHGTVVIEPQYDAAFRFHEGLGAFAVADDEIPVTRQRWGYLDVAGEVVIPASFQWTVTFSQGLAKVIQEGRTSFIDRQGEAAFPGTFAFAFDFSEGLAAVDTSERVSEITINSVRDGQWGFVNTQGEMVIPAVYDEARPFYNGLAAVKVDHRWGMIDKSGNIVLDLVYRSANHSSDPYLRAVNEEGYQLLFDYRGGLVIGPVYSSIGTLSEGLMAASIETDQGYRWGYINTDGEFVIAPTFEHARNFHEGFASVTIDGKGGYINRQGEFLWEPSL